MFESDEIESPTPIDQMDAFVKDIVYKVALLFCAVALAGFTVGLFWG
jgi:hypothetical protein